MRALFDFLDAAPADAVCAVGLTALFLLLAVDRALAWRGAR